jgi:hypothetical protein
MQAHEEDKYSVYDDWVNDWCLFAEEVLKVSLDAEQQAILKSVQCNKMTTVASGTARGKDFVSAVAAVCFLYLTPKWNDKGELVENTKVAMTAPTDRQVANIMLPEISRLFNRAKFLPGRITGYDIRTDDKEWFLTGFKADEHNHEAWSGFHAANTMFVVTEASGISESVFNAIEGNLQGNSRILIVFNPNVPTGYAASSQKSPRWHKFRLDSLNAPNVLNKNTAIPGQVDYEWVADKVKTWCQVIPESDFIEEEGDFLWEGLYYRPNDLFRVKVRGMFPKVASDVLIPLYWIEAAQKRYKEQKANGWRIEKPLRLGADIAGKGRDSSAFCPRYGNLVEPFEMIHSGGSANHMQVAGKIKTMLKEGSNPDKLLHAQAFIDTIGEGAGVFSRLKEQNERVFSVKYSEAAEYNGNILKDITGQYEFLNMRAWLMWAVRDWLNPVNKTGAMLPPDDELTEEMTETKWEFMSNGKIKIEPKDDIKARLKRSPDRFDALAMTFYPVQDIDAAHVLRKHKRLTDWLI